DPAVVGKTLTLNGHSYTVVGVGPASFRGLETGLVPDFWAPIIMQHEIAPGNDLLANRNAYWVFLAGRVKPGVTPGQAQAEMSVLTRQLTQAYPRGDKAWDAAISSIVGVAPEFREFVVPFTALLMAVVGLVLLIACANAANLLLAQASGRVREMAIRSALGAERSRLIRQVLTESILLSLAAGGVGFLLAIWSSPLLLRLKPAMLSFITLDLQPDWRIIGFTLFASLLTGFVFGLAPALRSSKVDVVSRLKGEAHGGFAKRSLRGALVVIQVAVCLVLLTSAGLCLRSLLNAQSIDPGFQIDNRLVVSLNVQILGYSEDRGRTFYQQVLDRVKAVPGVRSASLANYLPLGFTRLGVTVAIDGHRPPPGSPGIPVGLAAIAPEYFQTMGIPLLRGRDFGPQDTSEAPGVAIINEAMARRFWPGQDPIGRQVTFDFGNRPSFEIVGVVRTGKYHSLRETPEPFMYRPIAQFYSYRTTLIVRTANDPGPMLATVEREIHDLDPNLPVIGAETMRDYMKLPLFPARAAGILLGAFGLLALALAVTGLYGVVAYVVSQRTREIGIRMALGANQAEVLNMVLRQGLVLALAGVTLGVIMSLAVTHVLSKLLYGIRSTDPATYVAVSLVLMSVASLASYVPARRATKVDPMVALRYE
ncbi:MAG TPA: ABC transporter permease, partial [Candidatus Binatia bacterium]|nr:ABC transporter permease [Candidatus Binatia bacterium]